VTFVSRESVLCETTRQLDPALAVYRQWPASMRLSPKWMMMTMAMNERERAREREREREEILSCIFLLVCMIIHVNMMYFENLNFIVCWSCTPETTSSSAAIVGIRVSE
jgi:hypothetical protein